MTTSQFNAAGNVKAMPEDTFVIRVGRLQKIETLHKILASRLHEYSELYRKGIRPKIKLNLTELLPGTVGMAALTALMSITDRLRDYTDHAMEVDISWNPALFGFLDDIGVFRLAQQRDIFEIPQEMLGGYEMGATNPHTKIICFDNSEVPTAEAIGQSLTEWKDDIRTKVK